MPKCPIIHVCISLYSFLAIFGTCQLQSSAMKLVADSSGPVCAADRATTVFTSRSLTDCQRRCSNQKSKCYANNFYSDTKTCELYNFKPTTFTSTRKNCRLFSDQSNTIITNYMRSRRCGMPLFIDGPRYHWNYH